MALFLVTIKLPRNPAHDPKNKVAGPCPANSFYSCTDGLVKPAATDLNARNV